MTAPQVACPTCREKSAFSSENQWRPFCSQRCKLIDLGAWASEEYCVAGKSMLDDLVQPLDDVESTALSPPKFN